MSAASAASTTTLVQPKKRKLSTPVAAKREVRIIEALPGSAYHIPKLLVKKGDSFLVKHSGGVLRIDEVEVQSGGSFDADFKNAPPGWVIAKMTLAGGTAVNRF